MKKNQQGSVVIIIIVLLTVIIGGVYLYSKKISNSTVDINIPDVKATNEENTTTMGWKLFNSADNNFSIQYPEQKWVNDGKLHPDGGLYLHPATKPVHFSPDNITISFGASNAECNRISSLKQPDGQTVSAGDITFQHVATKSVENYEVFSKYFYSQNGKCYIATLHAFTMVTNTQDLESIDDEVYAYESNMKEILATFKLQ